MCPILIDCFSCNCYLKPCIYISIGHFQTACLGSSKFEGGFGSDWTYDEYMEVLLFDLLITIPLEVGPSRNLTSIHESQTNTSEPLWCRYLSKLLVLRLENNSIENGPLLRTPSPPPSPEADKSESEGERQGKTVNSVASTSRHTLQSLEVRRESTRGTLSVFCFIVKSKLQTMLFVCLGLRKEMTISLV